MINIAEYSAVLLAGIGLYIAGYFTFVYYGLLEANTRLMPRVCQLEDRSCKTVLGTRYARVFGVPNSLLGVVYYLIVIIVILGGIKSGPTSVALIAVSWFTVALGLVLAYSLFFIIRIPCPLCLRAHAINLALAVLLAVILT